MIEIDQSGLHALFERLARTLARGYRLDEAMTQLAGDIRETLDVAGAGVMVEDDDGDLRFMSTSDEGLRMLERLQIELDEGPCLLAYRTGEPVIASDLGTDPRFARFGPMAIAAHMRAVYSYPLHHDDVPIGAINLYRDEPGPLTEPQLAVVGTFAAIATAFIVHARDDDRRALLNRQLQHALDSRVVLEQAKGFVMGRCGVDAHLAFDMLRSHARNHSLRLRDVARDVLSGTLDAGELPVVEP